MNQDQDHDQIHFPFSTTPYDERNIHREQLSEQPPQGQEAAYLVMEQYLSDPIIQEKHNHEIPAKWMSSKMRLMKKMMGEKRRIIVQAQSNDDCSTSIGNNSPTGIIRVCSNCSTTKTPLWRSGPQGPKSLCNACGIRQMKARRAMRAAAAAANGGLVPASAPKKVTKEEKQEVDQTIPYKKRFKISASSSTQKKLRFDDITINLTQKLALHKTFPQEEKDAAILLMTLSCGLIHG